MQRKQVNLGECADKAIDTLSVSIEDKGVELCRDALPEVWGDATLLTQCYQNLISNAMKFAGDKPPKIHLTCEHDGKGLVFGVKDNGIGIKPDYYEQIFLPFKRLHGRSRFPGTGIGLAICRKVVERHNGKLWVESKPGEGAHFKFTIGERGDSKP